MHKKKYYIYKIFFISIFIVIILDINGYIKNINSFLFIFIAILSLTYGLSEINFFSVIFQKIMLLKKIFLKTVKNCFSFLKKNSKNIKKGLHKKKKNN